MDIDNGEPNTSLFFRDENFIKQYRLTIGNVLKYFQLCPFYDPSSVNAKLEMQQRSIDQLEKIDGISFRLTFAEQRNGLSLEGDDLKKPENQVIVIDTGLAIIDKVYREKEDEKTLAKYYVIDGSIYQAPDIYSVFNSRIRSAMFHVRESIREVKNMFEWNLQSGFRKKIAADETETPYTFSSSQLKDLNAEIGDEFKLQTSLLDSLLSEIGINKV
ncbi:hypothetical protein TRFO_21621 [Tritrichomonas foetus]|uniref:Mediator of RNA polymerase II transcription subunit 6 n=1 Tax=Tritrichomonas foetus TaxID=1144522 RepID=A0A1J4KI97_9EUKA|nr:hypothetical protein TRFO_21621 [Tritrichomonas foetus]|eukprot:OHT09406.1 hypothetical protein TRFO_21621 [Tritrichomonas foetus]